MSTRLHNRREFNSFDANHSLKPNILAGIASKLEPIFKQLKLVPALRTYFVRRRESPAEAYQLERTGSCDFCLNDKRSKEVGLLRFVLCVIYKLSVACCVNVRSISWPFACCQMRTTPQVTMKVQGEWSIASIQNRILVLAVREVEHHVFCAL